jgi:hypothetical protein
MPQSVTIAAFVLGAVLLLIAILHGGFKIFGAEVDGTAGRFGRIFAGLLGVILIAIGLFSPLYKQSPQPAGGPQKTASDASSSGEATPANTGTTQKQVDQAQPGKAGTEQSQSEQAVNIAGTWRDEDGSEFQITQHGNAFTMRITGMDYQGSSSGVLHGRDFERSFEGHWIVPGGQTSKGARYSGHCSGNVSTDASVMRNKCFYETGGRGPYEMVLTR